MTAITPSSFIDDAIAELVNDWKGHDADFWQTNGEMVCRWHTAKIRSYLAWEERAEIRAHKKQFRDRFLAASNIKLRRLQEGIAQRRHDPLQRRQFAAHADHDEAGVDRLADALLAGITFLDCMPNHLERPALRVKRRASERVAR